MTEKCYKGKVEVVIKACKRGINMVGGDDGVKASFCKEGEYNQVRERRDHKAKRVAYAKILSQEGEQHI